MKTVAFAFWLFIVLFAPLMTFVQSNLVLANAGSSIPKPSIPEFTVKLIDTSYYVPPTTSVDPYTGQTVTQGDYYVRGEPYIEIAIKNQPSTLSGDTASNEGMSLFYQVRIKGHFSQEWSVVEYWIKEAPAYNPRNPYPEQDYASQYTILKFGSLTNQNIPSEGQLDIQVQALIGYVAIHGDPRHSIDLHNQFASFEFTGETSGWSDTQTITLGESQLPTPSPATTPTPTPDQEPQQTDVVLIILALALIVIIVGAGVGLRVYLVRKK